MARSRWLTALVAVLISAATVTPAHAAAAEDQGGQRYHLALGDSLAYGFQRFKVGQAPSAFRTGYADLLAARLEHGGRLPELVNYGCPGETTGSFVAGPCPWSAAGLPLHDTYAGPQLDAATQFLRAHRGRVDLVTISLWGNDANAFVASCNGNVQCIVEGAPAAIAHLAGNLRGILQTLRAAAPDADLVVIGAYDANLGAFALTGPIFQALNQAMGDAARSARAAYVDPMPIFDAGNGAALCTYTLLCRDGDAHPSDAGYAVLADLAEAALD
jgi:lysophospholipase L1-like esterase